MKIRPSRLLFLALLFLMPFFVEACNYQYSIGLPFPVIHGSETGIHTAFLSNHFSFWGLLSNLVLISPIYFLMGRIQHIHFYARWKNTFEACNKVFFYYTGVLFITGWLFILMIAIFGISFLRQEGLLLQALDWIEFICLFPFAILIFKILEFSSLEYGAPGIDLLLAGYIISPIFFYGFGFLVTIIYRKIKRKTS